MRHSRSFVRSAMGLEGDCTIWRVPFWGFASNLRVYRDISIFENMRDSYGWWTSGQTHSTCSWNTSCARAWTCVWTNTHRSKPSTSKVIRIRSTSNTFNTLLPHPGKGVDGQIHCFRSNMSITSIDFHRLPRKSARNAWLAVPLLLCAAQAGWVMPLSCQATNLSMNQRFFFNHGGKLWFKFGGTPFSDKTWQKTIFHMGWLSTARKPGRSAVDWFKLFWIPKCQKYPLNPPQTHVSQFHHVISAL
jgi:hypothetical protein